VPSSTGVTLNPVEPIDGSAIGNTKLKEQFTQSKGHPAMVIARMKRDSSPGSHGTQLPLGAPPNGDHRGPLGPESR
jgi:hypothetical protein